MLRPLIGALLVSKILLIGSMIPAVNAFHDRPHAWGAAWKTIVYWILGILFQMAETVVEFLLDGQTIESAIHGMFEEVVSSQFLLIQMWLFVLLAIFVALVQLVKAVGPKKVRAMFFGSSHPEE